MAWYLYVIIAILFILIIFLLLPIRISIIYNNGLFLSIYIFGLKFKFPSDIIERESKFIRDLKEEGLGKTAKKLEASLDLYYKILKAIIKSIKIIFIDVNIIVATGNAALTAVAFGATNAGIYSLFSLINHITKVKNQNINIHANFTINHSKFELSSIISVIPGKILMRVLPLYITYIIKKNKKAV